MLVCCLLQFLILTRCARIHVDLLLQSKSSSLTLALVIFLT